MNSFKFAVHWLQSVRSLFNNNLFVTKMINHLIKNKVIRLPQFPITCICGCLIRIKVFKSMLKSQFFLNNNQCKQNYMIIYITTHANKNTVQWVKSKYTINHSITWQYFTWMDTECYSVIEHFPFGSFHFMAFRFLLHLRYESNRPIKRIHISSIYCLRL